MIHRMQRITKTNQITPTHLKELINLVANLKNKLCQTCEIPSSFGPSIDDYQNSLNRCWYDIVLFNDTIHVSITRVSHFLDINRVHVFDGIYDFDTYKYAFIPKQNRCNINVVHNDIVVPLPLRLYTRK